MNQYDVIHPSLKPDDLAVSQPHFLVVHHLLSARWTHGPLPAALRTFGWTMPLKSEREEPRGLIAVYHNGS